MAKGSAFIAALFPNSQFKLNKKHIRMGTHTGGKLFITKDKNGNFMGMFADIIANMARSLNFTYDIMDPKDGKWGTLQADGSWNGLIGELHRKELEFVAAPLGRHPMRETVMDFADVSLRENDYLATYNLPLYLRPLSTPVWLCILMTVIVSSIVLAIGTAIVDPHFMLFFSRGSKRNYLSVLYQHMTTNVFLVGTTLIGQSYALTSVNKSGNRNLIFGMLCLFSVILVTVWSAKIISYLTVSVNTPPFNTVY